MPSAVWYVMFLRRNNIPVQALDWYIIANSTHSMQNFSNSKYGALQNKQHTNESGIIFL